MINVYVYKSIKMEFSLMTKKQFSDVILILIPFLEYYYNFQYQLSRKTSFFHRQLSNNMIQKCLSCHLFYKSQQMQLFNCQMHFICNPCFYQRHAVICQQCQSAANQIARQQRVVYNYPIQGMMVNYDKKFNPEGQSQFSAMRNCHQRTTGWIMCNLLAIVFFFSGLAMAIRTSQLGIGIILAILGVIGVVVSAYFMCKIRKIDKHFQSVQYVNRDNSIHVKKRHPTISSVHSDRR